MTKAEGRAADRKKRILILGAAGFLGTNLTLRLLEQGERLLLFDRPGAVYPDAVSQFPGAQVRIAEGAFAEAAALLPLSEVDTVYHLISTTCPTNSNQDVAGEMEDNLIATVRFLDACAAAKVGKVVFLSSGGTVYGKEHTGICREEEEAFPITSYGVQKLAIEKMLYLYYQMYGLDYRIVRLANPYGPYQRPNGVQGVVTTFVHRALLGEPIRIYGDGSVVRDYLYVDDAVEGILRIANQKGRYRLYNLGSGRGCTVQEVAEAVRRELGGSLKIEYLPGRPVDVPVNVLDVSRFTADFGQLKPISLQEGIRRTAAWMRQNSAAGAHNTDDAARKGGR